MNKRKFLLILIYTILKTGILTNASIGMNTGYETTYVTTKKDAYLDNPETPSKPGTYMTIKHQSVYLEDTEDHLECGKFSYGTPDSVHWLKISAGNGLWRFQNVGTKKFLDDSDSKIYTSLHSHSHHTEWSIEKVGFSEFTLKNAATGRFLAFGKNSNIFSDILSKIGITEEKTEVFGCNNREEGITDWKIVHHLPDSETLW